MGLWSCEDAIDLMPKDKETMEDYFKRPSDLEMFTNPLYNNILPEADDVAKEISDVMVNASLSAFVRGGGDRTVPESGGGWTWTNLRRINDLLYYSDRCEDKDAVNQYNAVARFFRAYFYFEKVKRFGDVPWVDEPLGSDDDRLYNPRDSREFVMTKILEDLDFALEYLQNKDDINSEEKTFRATKGAALALKVRACLFEGTYRKYHNLTLKGHDYIYYLQQAADAAEKLMSGSYGKYAIYNTGNPDKDYINLFLADAANPDEYILARSYKGSISDNQHNLSLYAVLSTHGRPGFTRKFVNTYLMKDGTRFTDRTGWQTMGWLDEIKDRDPRLAQTIMTPGYCYPQETDPIAPSLAITPTMYLPIKWVQGPKDNNNTAHMSQGRCTNDIPAFRYAEVLLGYAEAKAELGKLIQADLDKSVNVLRKRVGMPDLILATANANPDPYLASATTGYAGVQDDNKGVILEIRRERTIEFAQENLRLYDLLRWHEGKCLDQAFSGAYFDGPCELDLKGNGKISLVLYAHDTAQPKVDNADSDCQFYEIGRDIFLTTDPAAKTGGMDARGYLNYHAGNKIARNGWNENRDYLYPLPSEEFGVNENLLQNPGW